MKALTLQLLKNKKTQKCTYFDIITGCSTAVTDRLYSGKLLSATEDGVRVSVSSSSVLTKASLLASRYATGEGQMLWLSFWNGWFLQRSECTAPLLAGYFGESSNWDELLVCEKESVSQWLENPGSAIESGEKGVVSSGILKKQRPGFCWPGFICRVGSNVKIYEISYSVKKNCDLTFAFLNGVYLKTSVIHIIYCRNYIEYYCSHSAVTSKRKGAVTAQVMRHIPIICNLSF